MVTPAEQLLRAAWREGLGDVRAQPPDGYRLTDLPLNQARVVERPTTPPHPADLSEHLFGPHPGLQAELHSAHTGHTLAHQRRQRRQHLWRALARHNHLTTFVDLVTRYVDDPNRRARWFELLQPLGHPLHPCARTRLGWTHHDMRSYDIETPRPVALVVAYHDGALHRHDPDGLLTVDGRPATVMHPWQWRTTDRGDLIDSGRRLPAWPTTSVRTLYSPDLNAYLKTSLDVSITSTRRTITPRTARLTPPLSQHIQRHLALPSHRLLEERASTWHPADGNHTLVLRAPLPDTNDGVTVPCHALPSASPVTGRSIAAELALADRRGPRRWWRDYVWTVLPPLFHLLVGHGIALEAHGQNCLVEFRSSRSWRLWSRDFGGVRLYRAHVPAVVRPESVGVWLTDFWGLRHHLSASLFHNHLAPIVVALSDDVGGSPSSWWRTVGRCLRGMGLPRTDRDFFERAPLPGKALLTAKLKGATGVMLSAPNPLWSAS